MKLIQAIIRPEKLEEVKNSLSGIGILGINITEVEGRGRQKGMLQQWRGEVYIMDFIPKIKFEMVINDEDVDKVIDAIFFVFFVPPPPSYEIKKLDKNIFYGINFNEQRRS